MINLGDIAKDTITGFKGKVIAKTEWLNGCKRITIQSTKLKDGIPADPQTFDTEQVEVIKAIKEPDDKPSGGPKNDPGRQSDPV